MSDDQPFDDAELPPSKSQRKREMAALQDLGTELVDLAAAELARIPLPDRLSEAIAQARAITSHGARRRQLQFIGKIMRDIDPAPIRAALEKIRQHSARATAELHLIERWRDRIIGEGQAALNEFSGQYPGADRQRLRQLMLNARKEQERSLPPKSSRALFRALREVIEAAD